MPEGGQVKPDKASYWQAGNPFNQVYDIVVSSNVCCEKEASVTLSASTNKLTNLKKIVKTPRGPRAAGAKLYGGGQMNQLAWGTAIGSQLVKCG
jgi:hypothetical protein